MEKYVAELLQLQTYFMHNVCNCAIYLSKTHNLTSDILLCNGRWLIIHGQKNLIDWNKNKPCCLQASFYAYSDDMLLEPRLLTAKTHTHKHTLYAYSDDMLLEPRLLTAKTHIHKHTQHAHFSK